MYCKKCKKAEYIFQRTRLQVVRSDNQIKGSYTCPRCGHVNPKLKFKEQVSTPKQEA